MVNRVTQKMKSAGFNPMLFAYFQRSPRMFSRVVYGA
jgi:hypothetical protein